MDSQPAHVGPRWPFRRLTFAALLLVALAIGLLPFILSRPSIVRSFTEKATKKIAGKLDVEQVQLGWFRKVCLEDICFAAPDDRPVLEVGRIETDRSILSLLTDRSSFGSIRCVGPTVYLLIDEHSNNVAEAVRPRTESQFIRDRVEDLKKLDDSIAGEVHLVDGKFVFQSAQDRPQIELSPIELHASVLPNLGPEQPRRLELHPGSVFHELELTRELCNDLVQYVAPILARASWVKGSVSLEIDQGNLPVKRLADSALAGRLIVHDITAGPGPILTALTKMFELDDEIQLVDDSQIQFALANQEVTHRGLEFKVGQVRIQTQGAVRFDQSMDLIALVQFPEIPDGDGELARRLAGRMIRLPITGQITKPKINWKSILDEHPFIDEALKRLLDREETPVLDMLREIRRRRRGRPNR